MSTDTIGNFAPPFRAVGVVAMTLASLHCGETREPTIEEPREPRIVPLNACRSTGREVECNLEVVPGLELIRASGVPEEPVATPQPRLCFHWRRTDALGIVPKIDVSIWASNRLGRTRVGFFKLHRVLPHPHLWETNVCFPACCELTVPIAAGPTEWILGCRISPEGLPSQEVDLGTIEVR